MSVLALMSTYGVVLYNDAARGQRDAFPLLPVALAAYFRESRRIAYSCDRMECSLARALAVTFTALNKGAP